jgi:hypothetical protein
MIPGYDDLTSHSNTLTELHTVAGLAARMVLAVRDNAALLPPELGALAQETEQRPSVARRLKELTAKDAA